MSGAKKQRGLIIEVLCFLIILLMLFLFIAYYLDHKQYQVSFINDGKLVDTQLLKEHDIVSVPDDLSRDGYNFLGWYLNDEKYDFNTPITSDLKLIAKWESTSSHE